MRLGMRCLVLSTIFGVCLAGSAAVHAQSAAEVDAALTGTAPRDRVLLPVEENDRITLQGNTLPQVLAASETAPVEGATRLDHMLLVLKPDAEQQAALDALLEAQHDPQSLFYHAWLTPEIYAAHFGISRGDLEQVQSWLERNGFQVDEVAASRRTLAFSGTEEQVERAFQTTIRSYRRNGKTHIANSSDPTVPTAFAEVIDGVVSLHDVFSKPLHEKRRPATNWNGGNGAHYLSPADFATIYDVASLYHQAYDGTGETIAIVGRADISLPDVRSFRSTFGLVAKDPVVITNGPDPGSANGDDVDEAMLDTEWSGAVANKATIDFVTSASTQTSDGVFLSAQYVVNHNLAPVMSMSFGLCEADLGTSGNSFINALWQQAAAEGIAVLVSSGDSGAAGCDSSSATGATHGRGINGLCSTPYSTCVGGTQFADTANSGLYWSNTTSSAGNSALSYIPEVAWNESGSGGLWSTGGGVSTVYAKPTWQVGPGVPADGKRDVPDVALTAAGHDAYLVGVDGALYAISGTSAAAPSFAGVLALVTQKAAGRLGNANPELYSLAQAQRSASGTAVFHDPTSGTNSVPGVTGYSAGLGYDPVTGLGSVDAEQLVTAWGGATGTVPAPAFTLSLSAASFTLLKGATAAITIKTPVTGGFSSPVVLSISGSLPTGLTAAFTPATIATPATGSSVLRFTAGTALAPGSWTITVTATSGSVSKTATVTGSMAGLTVTAAPAATTLTRGGTLAISVNTTGAYGYNASTALAVSGLPSGVTAKFVPTGIGAPGTGSSILTLTASKTANLGAARIQVTATGGSLSSSAAASFTVITAATGTSAHLRPLR